MAMKLSERIKNSSSCFEEKLVPSFPQKNMLLEVSNYCNHTCLFCANKKMTRKRGFLSLELAEKVLKEAYLLGTREVGFYATGEPLTNPNLAQYIHLAKTIGYTYTYLTTNGALLDEGKLIKLIEAGLDSIKFSINAGKKETYARIHGKNDFEKVIEHIKFTFHYRKMQNLNYRIYVSFIVNAINENETDTLKRKIQDYIDEIVFLDVVNQGGMMYEINDKLIPLGKKIPQRHLPCPLLFNAFTVTCEGYLSACCTDFQNYLIIADLNSVDLKTAWESKKFQELRRRHLSKEIKGIMCYNCIYNKNEEVFPFTAKYAAMI